MMRAQYINGEAVDRYASGDPRTMFLNEDAGPLVLHVKISDP